MKPARSLILGCLAALTAFAASAQTLPPFVSSLNQNDAVQVVPHGAGSAQSVYATPGQIAGVESYSYQVPLTAFTITVANGIDWLYLNPAGTLATGTVTMPAQPSDGGRLCVSSTQTQTAITMTANTGQAFASFGLGTVTALVANTRVCWFYEGPLAVWVRYI